MENVVRVFLRFEEADEADLSERRSMTPEARVEAFLAIQQRSFLNGAYERSITLCDRPHSLRPLYTYSDNSSFRWFVQLLRP